MSEQNAMLSAPQTRRAWSRSSSGGAAGNVAQGLEMVAAALLLLFLAPVMVVIGLAIYLQDGGPVLFSHRRLGRGGRKFGCLKFRSMVRDADDRLRALLANDPEARAAWEREHKLKNDPRITPLGRFLRKSSLDELPQLINVLRGEMRLVGPRPIVESEIAKYGRYYSHYCRVQPGLTGLWQVSGRNDVDYRKRVALDVIYSRRATAGLDLWILVATVPAVLRSRGSY